MQSPLAIQRPAFRKRWRKIQPWGLLVHTMGRGVYRQDDPFGWALRRYRWKGSVHYCIDTDGKLFQMLLDNRRGAHVGISKKERLRYLSGDWRRDFNPDAVELWDEKWHGYKSPQHLYPTKSPNDCYIGVELRPLRKSRANGLYFSDEQHEAVARLGADLMHRHQWPSNWKTTSRLLGHECVDAYGRWVTKYTDMPWDPGALRQIPRFSWAKVIDG